MQKSWMLRGLFFVTYLGGILKGPFQTLEKLLFMTLYIPVTFSILVSWKFRNYRVEDFGHRILGSINKSSLLSAINYTIFFIYFSLGAWWRFNRAHKLRSQIDPQESWGFVIFLTMSFFGAILSLLVVALSLLMHVSTTVILKRYKSV